MRPTGHRVLVFTKTAGYRHDSTAAGVEALGELFEIDATDDADVFTAANVRPYGAVVFLNTSGTVLDDDQCAALDAYVRGGGGFVGIHGAANTQYDSLSYGELLGAWFDRHPEVQQATLQVDDPDHPATVGLPPIWTRVDEWYDFRTNPRGSAHVLLTVDESSYRGGGMGGDHPIAWCRSHGLGRSFYTALGHTVESYAELAFRSHVAGGIRYAAG